MQQEIKRKIPPPKKEQNIGEKVLPKSFHGNKLTQSQELQNTNITVYGRKILLSKTENKRPQRHDNVGSPLFVSYRKVLDSGNQFNSRRVPNKNVPASSNAGGVITSTVVDFAHLWGFS